MKSETQIWIEDAIKGGWRTSWHWDEENYSEDEIIESLSEYKDEWYTNYYGMVVNTNHPFLDPLAWQAVGKTRGWDFAYCYQCHTKVALFSECECDEDEVTPIAKMGWHFKWVGFIDTLADGKTIEEALLTIK
jgi:hypothetical protein